MTSEEQERYSSIIDAILATANLETITRKKIIKGLETSLRGKDLSDQKVRCSIAGIYLSTQYSLCAFVAPNTNIGT